MKWLGQYIQDLPSRFRDDVYLEELATTTETSVLVVDSDGKVSKSTTLADDIIESEIDTLAGLTSFGSAGATTNIVAGDVTMYNPVNDGNPTFSIGSSATNRFETSVLYNDGSGITTHQHLDQVIFKTYTDSVTTNDGRFSFYVDEVIKMAIKDDGAAVYGSVYTNADGASLRATDTTTSSATEGGALVLQSDDGAAMASGHRLGVVEFKGAEDASNTRSIGARIEALADGTWSGSENKANLLFYTTDGTTESEVLKLDSDKLATFAGKIESKNTTTSSATEGGILRLSSDDGAALGDDHRLGALAFQAAEDGSSTVVTGASIQAFADAAWSGSENGTRLEFYTMDGDASKELSLTLDSDLLATFAGGVTVTGALTGTLATATQPNIDSIGTDGDILSILGDQLNMTNATANKPEIKLVNNTDDATGPIFYFLNQRSDSGIQAGEDNDVIGNIDFWSYDDQPAAQPYAKIYSDIHDATSGEESGRLTFQVANHDGGLGSGLILTGGSVDNEIDVFLGLGAASQTIIKGTVDIEGSYCNIAASASYSIDDTAIISDSSGTATLSNIDALDATTAATIQAASTHKQIVNLKGFATLEDGNYLFAQDFGDNKAPWLLSQDYTSGTINSSTELQQRFFIQAGGFHVPIACTLDSIQVQATVDGSGGGNVTVAVVEYRPSEHADDRQDYPRTVYEEVVVGSNNHQDKVKTVNVALAALDATVIPAGSHLLIMVKGDGDTDGDEAVVSVSMVIDF